jgi:Flp pilus assembly pilin Flp
MRALWKLLRDDRGVGAIEYALIASLISVAAVAAFDHMGSAVEQKYEAVDQKL